MADNKQVKRLSKPCYTGYSIVRRVIMRESSDWKKMTWKKGKRLARMYYLAMMQASAYFKKKHRRFRKIGFARSMKKMRESKSNLPSGLGNERNERKETWQWTEQKSFQKVDQGGHKNEVNNVLYCRDNDRSAGSGGNLVKTSPLFLP